MSEIRMFCTDAPAHEGTLHAISRPLVRSREVGVTGQGSFVYDVVGEDALDEARRMDGHPIACVDAYGLEVAVWALVKADGGYSKADYDAAGVGLPEAMEGHGIRLVTITAR